MQGYYTQNELTVQISNINEQVKEALDSGQDILVITGGKCFKYKMIEYNQSTYYNSHRDPKCETVHTIKGIELKEVK